MHRPKDWLNEFDTARLELLAKGVTRLWKTGTDPRSYTPHDPGHFKRVEANLRRLLPVDTWTLISNQERFLLSCAAWTHDIAMHPAAYGEDGDKLTPSQIRKKHVEASADWVLRHRKEYDLSHNEAVLIAEICRHHSRFNDIRGCSTERICQGELVRPQLLACYLRLADALEIAHARVEDSEISRFLFLQEVIADNADFTLFHWIKSFVVAGIAVLHKERTLQVEFQLPKDDLEQVLGRDVLSRVGDIDELSSLPHSIAESSPRYHLLTQYALDELRNELETVEDILAACGPTSFHIVEALDTVRILKGAATPPWSIGLRRVVNYLNVAYSPNSSGTAGAALNAIDDAISVICDRSGWSIDELRNRKDGKKKIGSNKVLISRDAVIEVIPHLRKSLQARQSQRRCHNELRRITDFVVEYAQALIKFEGDEYLPWVMLLDEFRNNLGAILDADGDRMQALRANFASEMAEHIVKNGQKLNVLLFGNSATVADALASLIPSVVPNGVHCYIAEGRGKSKHGPHNKPVYLDAETYAANVRSSLEGDGKEKSRSDVVSIEVIPDTAVGRVLDRNHTDSEHPQADVVLFGANGIFREPDVRVAHTCGHLCIAATAKHFGVPVYVLSSVAKISQKPYSRWRDAIRERNEWIAGKASDVIERLEGVGASAEWNPSEEQIGIDLVDKVVTDAGICDFADGARTQDYLAMWETEIESQLKPSTSFAELLEKAQ